MKTKKEDGRTRATMEIELEDGTIVEHEAEFEVDCPVCDEPLDGFFECGERCSNCGWIDNAPQLLDVDYDGGPNRGVTLRQARKNYVKLGRAIPERKP